MASCLDIPDGSYKYSDLSPGQMSPIPGLVSFDFDDANLRNAFKSSGKEDIFLAIPENGFEYSDRHQPDFSPSSGSEYLPDDYYSDVSSSYSPSTYSPSLGSAGHSFPSSPAMSPLQSTFTAMTVDDQQESLANAPPFARSRSASESSFAAPEFLTDGCPPATHFNGSQQATWENPQDLFDFDFTSPAQSPSPSPASSFSSNDATLRLEAPAPQFPDHFLSADLSRHGRSTSLTSHSLSAPSPVSESDRFLAVPRLGRRNAIVAHRRTQSHTGIPHIQTDSESLGRGRPVLQANDGQHSRSPSVCSTNEEYSFAVEPPQAPTIDHQIPIFVTDDDTRVERRSTFSGTSASPIGGSQDLSRATSDPAGHGLRRHRRVRSGSGHSNAVKNDLLHGRPMTRDLSPSMYSDSLPSPTGLIKSHVGSDRMDAAARKRRSHPASFKCQEPGCHKTFTAHHNLKNHMNSHYGVRNWSCDRCDQKFGTAGVLNRHRTNSCRGQSSGQQAFS